MTDEELIAAFEPAMLGLLPAEGQPVHAESLLALCLADGLLEVMQWAKEGTGADPAASMWLGALRWHRLISGAFPAGAPEPVARPTDHALGLILSSGGAEIVPGSAESSLAGLASGAMGTRAEPAQPEAGEDSALIRVLPISLAPYVDDQLRQDWAEEAICLTHGHPQLREEARRRATLRPAPEEAGPRHQLLGVVVEDLVKRWKAATT